MLQIQRRGQGEDNPKGGMGGLTKRRREEKEKCHSMIMYELSAELHGGGKGCSGPFKKKIIMSGYSNTPLNTDFPWVLVLWWVPLGVNIQRS